MRAVLGSRNYADALDAASRPSNIMPNPHNLVMMHVFKTEKSLRAFQKKLVDKTFSIWLFHQNDDGTIDSLGALVSRDAVNAMSQILDELENENTRPLAL